MGEQLMMATVNLALIIATIAALATIVVRIEMRERRVTRMESEVTYIRRDLDQILKLYRLMPVSEQDKRRRK